MSGSRSVARSRIRGDGWISGLGGQDRVLGGALPGGERRALVLVVGVFDGSHQALAFGQPAGEFAALPGQVADPLAELGDLLSRSQGDLGTLFLCSGLRFSRAQRRVLLFGVAAAQFGVGGHGQLPLPAGGLLPVGSVGHDGGEHSLALGVGVVHGLVAGRENLLLMSLFMLAPVLGGAGLGAGADGRQLGFLGTEADLAEFVADPLRGPGGFDGIGVAQVQQRPIGQAADIGAVYRAEGGEGLVPGGPLVGVGRYGLGSGRLGGMVVAA